MNERQQAENIRYGGYTTEPSDYDNPDGDLATCIGLVNEEGGLKPVLPPGVACYPFVDIGTGKIPVRVIFCHKNMDWVHYIGVYETYVDGDGNPAAEGTPATGYAWLGYPCNVDETGEVDDETIDGWGKNLKTGESSKWGYFWTVKDNGWQMDGVLLFAGETHRSITAIGNMLIVSTDKHIHYFLYQSKEWTEDGSYLSYHGYKYLGTSVPKIQMEFALDGELYAKYYDDLGLELSTGEDVTTDDWEIVKQQSCTFGANADTTTISVGLSKNTTYSIRFGEKSKANYQAGNWQWTIYFVTASGRKDLASFKIITDEQSTFTPTLDYVKIELTSPALNQHTQTVIIEKKSTVYIGKEIKYDEANYTAVMGVINSYVNQFATEKNRHIYPFFIRYAVKLYSGDYIHLSPPILMIPNSGYSPYMVYTDSKKMEAFALLADVQAKVIGYTEDALTDWEDIINGVDIFFSQPIYPYNQGQEYSKYEKYLQCGVGTSSVGYMSASFQGVTVTTSDLKYINLVEAVNKYIHADDGAWNSLSVQIAPLTTDEIMTRVKSASAFYKVKSFSISDLKNMQEEFTTLELEKGALKNLVARTVLDDDILASRTMQLGDLYAYNKRLHIFNASYKLASPYALQQTNQKVYTGNSVSKITDVWVLVKTDEGTKCVHSTVDISYLDDTGMAWFFYPDNNAYEMYERIVNEEMEYEWYVKKTLTRHDTLNGAYWCADSLNIYNINYTGGNKSDIPGVDDQITNVSNIYVSEVNNPFAFKSENVVSIDATRIIGLCTAAKAMSTGQFGQFPLYAFTDNGVWAMELTSTGVYKATQPITRDVCVNAASITQLDGEVVFATARGIMLLSGSSSTCLSDTLDAEKQFVLTDIMTEKQAQTLLGYVNAGSGAQLELAKMKVTSFFDYIKGCRCVYDYIRQRIIVYNPSYGYAYVYSIKGKSWGMVQSDLASTVNSYPDALAMDGDGNLVDFSLSDAKGVNGLVVTRPMKFSVGDAYKTVDTIVQRGYFQHGHVQQVLYGSNDLFHWQGVWSSTDEYLRGFAGTPYKYFRLALVCKLDEDESVSGLTVRYEPRLTNRPR